MSHPTALRQVYVVETWLEGQRCWHRWATHLSRADAWEEARAARHRYPKNKFRTIPYVNTKP